MAEVTVNDDATRARLNAVALLARPDAGDMPDEIPSNVVLYLRPDGSRFNGNRRERAYEAGFDNLKGTNLVGLSDPDTGDEIARHVVDVNSIGETLGRLEEIQVHINPQTCAWKLWAGQYLMERLKKYAVLIGAHVCDSTGRVLTEDEIDVVGKQIDVVMVKRRDADWKARTVTLPSGERRQLSELSFAYTVVREAGSRKWAYREECFDAPAMPFYEGQEMGMQMAGEIVQFYRKHRMKELPLRDILRAAMRRAGDGYGSFDEVDTANVALGFVDVMETLIEVGARCLNPAWLEQHIERNRESHQSWCAYQAKRKTEFVERMRKARAAKRAAALNSPEAAQ